ncbi:MAG: flagellar biosynthetic protein FliR [Planctomycetes bacterium]|nr:flagellar biosynthetic protein FliR [Planctomycetota bacterium]
MIDTLVETFALTLARVGTFIFVMPLLGGPNVPRTVKIGLSFSLAVLFFDVRGQDASVASNWFSFGLALGREAILGGLVGLALSLFLMPARIAGALIAQETGLTYASVVTTSGAGSTDPFSALLEMLASMVFFALDLHHVFLMLLQSSFHVYPIGRAYVLPSWDLLTAVSMTHEGGILLAVPVALCLFLTTVVLVMMSRAAPQLNIYSVGFPLRILVGLGAIVVLVPAIVTGMVGLFTNLIAILQLRG